MGLFVLLEQLVLQPLVLQQLVFEQLLVHPLVLQQLVFLLQVDLEQPDLLHPLILQQLVFEQLFVHPLVLQQLVLLLQSDLEQLDLEPLTLEQLHPPVLHVAREQLPLCLFVPSLLPLDLALFLLDTLRFPDFCVY